MSDNLHVIVSHPARQANIYYRPCAAEQMGASVQFLTGLYYRPERLPYSLVRLLPKDRRRKVEFELEKRRLAGLSPENVISLLGPLLEVTMRPLGRVRQWWAIHDWLASRWIRRYRVNGAPTILHCFQDSCVRTLAAAGSKRIIRLLEVTLPPPPATPELASAADRDGQSLSQEARGADFLLAQSEYTVRTLEAAGISPERIFRCHLGVDTSYFKPRTGPRQPGPLRVAFLGGASLRKGVHHLLKAWSEARPDGAELLLAGNRTAGIENIPPSIPSCRVLGRLPDREFLEFLQSADLLVHPSLAEGGCNVVYEAMACGMPAIVSSNATSAVRHEIEGIVFPVGDVEALKTAMQRLCADAGLRRRMGEAARRRAESLRWQNYLENLASIYRALGEYARTQRREALEPALGRRF
jgi:glycosyltransferase involved in cell wall biosynthesis